MWEYFQINLALFALASLALLVLRSAPARVQFYIAVSAIVVWAVPWHLLNISLPQLIVEPIQQFKVHELQDINPFYDDNGLIEKSVVSDSANGTTNLAQTLSPTSSSDISFTASVTNWMSELLTPKFILLALFLVGLWLTVVEITNYFNLIKDWKSRSASGDHLKASLGIKADHVTLRLLDDVGPGMTTGFYRPVIWISSKIHDRSNLRTILVHELTHIRNHDIAWLWLITVAHRLFWWNPAVRIMCAKARDYIEFSCDESSKKCLGAGQYAASLTRLVLNADHYSNQGVRSVLGVQNSKNVNVRRVEALAHDKKLAPFHVILIAVFCVMASWVSLAIAYDRHFVDLFLSSQNLTDRVAVSGANVPLEIAQRDKMFRDFMSLLYTKNYDEAEIQFHRLSSKLQSMPLPQRTQGFRALAAYLGDRERFSEIPTLLMTLLPDISVPEDWSVSRMMMISYIKTKQYKNAINLMLEIESTGYRGYPNRLLFAQAYHLNGEYEKSNLVIEDTLPLKQYSFFHTPKIQMLQLYGKNSLLLGDKEKFENAKNFLGDEAPSDFMTVRADQQSMPYLYFLYKSVDGIQIDGFDDEAFPIVKNVPQSQNAKAQNFIDRAMHLAGSGKLIAARDEFHAALELVRENNERQTTADILEYMYMLNYKMADREALESLSEIMIQSEKVSVAFKARAYWTLASGLTKYSASGIDYFEQYLALSPKPSLATDHEALDRYFWEGNPENCRASLDRVIAFYKQKDLIPDIRTLNRIIGVSERLGREEDVKMYRSLYAEHYPRALDQAL